MKISIGADHAGVDAKARLKALIVSLGHEVVDRGADSALESVDYPDYAAAVAGDVAGRRADRGVLVCGTGIGMSMTANKVAGIRAALCHDEFTAAMSRKHNDANVLCMGARVMDAAAMEKALRTWLETAFEGGRHERRVRKIETREE